MFNSIEFLYEPIVKAPEVSMNIMNKRLRKGTINFVNFNGFWKKEIEKPSLKDINYHF